MVTRTFLDKTNTIEKGSNANYGLHPIVMFNSEGNERRVLLHFSMDNIKDFINCKEKKDECKHILKMVNCGSLDKRKFGMQIHKSDTNTPYRRATSFDILAFPIKEEWDEGIGFDSYDDFWLSGDACLSNEGSNWTNSKSGLEWKKSGCIGISYDEGKAIATQHFDHGNENLELDITEYVNSILNGDNNYGICLVMKHFATDDSELGYVGFFSNETNTFYEPVVESRINDSIQDNRFNFALGKENRLYLYCYSDNEFLDLKHNPICEIDDIEYPVIKQDKGIYYALVNISGYTESDIILYYIWSDIELADGTKVDNVEMQFVTHNLKSVFNFGNNEINNIIYEPSLSGVNDDEILNNDDVRKVNVKFRKPYSNEYNILNNCYYRVYSKDNNREIDVIDWDIIDNYGNENTFFLKANELVTGNYFVDIKSKTKTQTKVFKEVLRFKKENNITRIRH